MYLMVKVYTLLMYKRLIHIYIYIYAYKYNFLELRGANIVKYIFKKTLKIFKILWKQSMNFQNLDGGGLSFVFHDQLN